MMTLRRTIISFTVVAGALLAADAGHLRNLATIDAGTTACGTMTCASNQVCATFTGQCQKVSPACTEGQVLGRWTGDFQACIDPGQCGQRVDNQDPGYVPSNWKCGAATTTTAAAPPPPAPAAAATAPAPAAAATTTTAGATTPCGSMTCASNQVCGTFTGVCQKISPACTEGQVNARWTGDFQACIDPGQCGVAVANQDPGYVPSNWRC